MNYEPGIQAECIPVFVRLENLRFSKGFSEIGFELYFSIGGKIEHITK